MAIDISTIGERWSERGCRGEREREREKTKDSLGSFDERRVISRLDNVHPLNRRREAERSPVWNDVSSSRFLPSLSVPVYFTSFCVEQREKSGRDRDNRRRDRQQIYTTEIENEILIIFSYIIICPFIARRYVASKINRVLDKV